MHVEKRKKGCQFEVMKGPKNLKVLAVLHFYDGVILSLMSLRSQDLLFLSKCGLTSYFQLYEYIVVDKKKGLLERLVLSK